LVGPLTRTLAAAGYAEPMFDRFTDRAKKVLGLARETALELHHDQIKPEHLLLGLIEEGTGVAVHVLRSLGVDLVSVRRDLEQLTPTGEEPVDAAACLPFSPAAKIALEVSMTTATRMGHDYIGTEHLVLGLASDGAGRTAEVLRRHAVEGDALHREVLEFVGEAPLLPTDPDWQPPGLPATSRMVWTHWYTEGRPQSEGCYQDGRRQGHWTFWTPDGAVDPARTGQYVDGERTGD
jgi:hypothetical protein